jgi:hypothetical protein
MKCWNGLVGFSPQGILTSFFFGVDNTGRRSDKMDLTLLQLSWMLLKLEIFGVKSKVEF